jgi:hypothetical protein
MSSYFTLPSGPTKDGRTEAADRTWRQAGAPWSQAPAAKPAALELFRHTGVTKFSPVKPQRRVVSSFGHRRGRHGVPGPHGRDLVI